MMQMSPVVSNRVHTFKATDIVEPKGVINFLQKKKSYYDESAKKVDPAQPAFTRRREVFVGRLASKAFLDWSSVQQFMIQWIDAIMSWLLNCKNIFAEFIQDLVS